MKLPRLLLLSLLLNACTAIPGLGGGLAGPTPPSVPTAPALPAAEVTFRLIPPPGTPAQEQISLVVLDEVAGFPFHQQLFAMRRLSDGRYEVTLTPPVGSLLRYRYRRVAPGEAEEFSARGQGVEFRLAHVTGPGVVDDVAAAWSDAPYLGPTGRIVGHITDASSGTPLPEILVNAAGLVAFTDGEGFFRLDGLPPGMHSLVAMSPDGAYRPWQQNAVVAADSATPAEFGLEPAQPVAVSFEVTVPADTPIGGPLRLAGNLRSLGDVFAGLDGGVRLSSAHMPTFTLVDATHYILITTLHAGTDLRYAYTLGDGRWNVERSAKGEILTRQLIVPEHELIVQDVVATWHSGEQAPITLTVTVPDNTPPQDALAVQFNAEGWSEPLPMVRSGSHGWTFTLFGPFDTGTSLGYRYCRNLRCGAADDADTSGPAIAGRPLTPDRSAQSISDAVRAWQWWGATVESIIVPGGLQLRPGYEAGVEFSPAYDPSWRPFLTQSLTNVAGGGASAVVLSPAWTMRQNAPTPQIAFDPATAPFGKDLAALVVEGRRLGLQVDLHPRLRAESGDAVGWWSSAPRDLAWWDVWYESYRSLVLRYARLAAEAGADELILGGPEVSPALPGGLLADGAPSGAPADAEARWRALINDVSAVYRGRLAFEIELGRSLLPLPPFLGEFNEIHVYWHASLGDRPDLSAAEMQIAAETRIQQALLAPAALSGRPIVLSVEYLSLDGGATACPPAPDGSCRPAEVFDAGAVVDPELPVDLREQAEAFNAVLSAAHPHPEITGFYARGYNPAVALQDKSASVNGKPAQDVLWYWYSSLTGR
ncbi:MAG: carboxypeptidase regulatory-like domain-containing protein [Chloroflexota bacterium]